MKERLIIFATLCMLLISFTFLAIIQEKQADIDSKNIWMIYFTNPKDNSLDFTIENHSQQSEFHWKVNSNKSILQESDTKILNGKNENIPLNIQDVSNKRITITVSTKDNTKEIYKNF